jgi:hypothetical protein
MSNLYDQARRTIDHGGGVMAKHVSETYVLPVDYEGCLRVALDVHKHDWKYGEKVRVTVERLPKRRGVYRRRRNRMRWRCQDA